MGTKVHCKSFLPGYYPMRDLNEDSSSSSWPQFNGEKNVANGQYIDGFMSRTNTDGYSGYDKDEMKQKILEHETVFRNQVYELHRVYRLQRDMMEEVRGKELHKRGSVEPSSSCSLQGFQVPSERFTAGFPLSYSDYGRTSIMGVEITNSPSSCMKRNGTQPSQSSFQSRFTLKECEALDSRPVKVRKKLFDLQLPAEDYVDSDEGENLQECKVLNIPSYTPEGQGKNSPGNRMKSIVGSCSGMKIDNQAGVFASGAHLKVSVGLADLNEPIHIEESMPLLAVEFHGRTLTNGESKGVNQLANTNADFFGVTHNGIFSSASLNKREPAPLMYEAGSSNNSGSYRHVLRQDKLHMPPHPLQGAVNQLHHPPGTYPTFSSANMQRDGSLCGEFFDISCDNSHNGRLEPLAASQSSYPFFSSPCFTGSRPHPVSSWAKPKSSFTQQIITSESPVNSAVSLDRRIIPSTQSQEPFAGKWSANVCSKSNQGFKSKNTLVNGFCHGSAIGSEELQVSAPSARFGHLNCSGGDKTVSGRLANQGFGIFGKSPCQEDAKRVLDINLNDVVWSSSNKPVILQDLNLIDGKGKPEDSLPVLPWLRPKPPHGYARDSSHLQAPFNQLWRTREVVGDLNEPFVLASTDCETVRTKESSQAQIVKKILGFSVVDAVASKLESSPHVSTSSNVNCLSEKKKNTSNKRKKIIIDINLACEPDEQITDEELTMEKMTSSGRYIDLNSCISDYEDPPVMSRESKSNTVKEMLKIDLEVPVSLQNGDDDTPFKEHLSGIVPIQPLENEVLPIQDEVIRIAANTMVAISSFRQPVRVEDNTCHSSEASLADSILWLVGAMSMCAVELEQKSVKESILMKEQHLLDFTDDVDEFEAMTLQLNETKQEHYMPLPFVSEAQIDDETATNTRVTRARRGQSRRGRQRRDFQRDILPGLISLSRHEVIEDLQTFGGLMRATGHHWNHGLTRRNGGRSRGPRGRRRAVAGTATSTIPSTVCTPLMLQANKIEAGLEDINLAGWGKTTRRPRRQRCPIGNPQNVALT